MKKLLIGCIVLVIATSILIPLILVVGMGIRGLNSANSINRDSARKSVVSLINEQFVQYLSSHNNVYPADAKSTAFPLVPAFINPANCRGEGGDQVRSITANGQCIDLQGLFWSPQNDPIGTCNTDFTAQSNEFILCYDAPSGANKYRLGTLLADPHTTPFFAAQ